MAEPETIYVVGHKNPDTDSVCSAIAYARFKALTGDPEHKAVRCGELNPETKFLLNYFKVPEPELIKSIEKKKVILVDHHELGQVCDGVKDAVILEVIDHHRVSPFETASPILFHTEPVGSTATIIADFFFYQKVTMPKEIAGILLGSILSDTVIFKSPTTTLKDKQIAQELNKIVGISIESFGIELKKAKSSIKGTPIKDIIMADFKEFSFSGTKVGIGQIEVVEFSEAEARKAEITAELKKIMEKEGMKLACLMITNIMTEGTKLLFAGDKGIVEKAFNKQTADSEVYLENVMSRKKQIVPEIQKVLTV